MHSQSTSMAEFEYQNPAYAFTTSGPSPNVALYSMEPQQTNLALAMSILGDTNAQEGSIEPSRPAHDRVMSPSSSESSFNQSSSSKPAQYRAVIRSRGSPNAVSKNQKRLSSPVGDFGAGPEPDEAGGKSLSTNKRARKDATKAASSDGDGSRKKHRGRPRINENESENIDRRRTQIREAQRAYRLRKEDTISTLTEKCDRLQQTIDDMSQSFLSMTEKFLEATPNDSMAPIVQSATQQFLELARRSSGEAASEKKEADDVAEGPAPAQSSSEDLAKEVGQDSVWGYPILIPEDPPTQPFASNYRPPYVGHATYTPPKSPQMQEKVPDYLANISSNTYPPFLETERSHNAFFPPVAKELDLPATHAYRESSFARRLQRRALEKAYYVLTTPGMPEWLLQHVFKLSFCFSDRQGIINRVRYLLSRSDKQSLEFWEAPWSHLGGSGSHFENGRPVQATPGSPNWAVRSIGPQVPIRNASSLEGECNEPENLISLTGFDGEWFDAHDVERYLRLKGLDMSSEFGLAQLRIPPESDEADANQSPGKDSAVAIEDDFFTQGQTSTTAAIPASSYAPPSEDGYVARLSSAEYGTEPQMADSFDEAFLDPSAFFSVPEDKSPKGTLPLYSSTTSRLFALNDARARTGPQGERTPETPKESNLIEVTVDVSKLIEELSSGSICLGRSPGFRKSEVDKAIRQTAWVF